MERSGFTEESHFAAGCFSLFMYQKPKANLWIGSQRGGGGGGGPCSPAALKFLLWSPEPCHFTDWSPDPFLAVEPGAQRHFSRSPEPSNLKFDHSSSQIASILDYWPFCVCLCVLTGIKKQNLKRGQYIIQVYAVISVYNDMQQLI